MIVYANYDYYKLKQLQEQTMGKTHEVTKNTEGSVNDIRLPTDRQVPIEVRESIP